MPTMNHATLRNACLCWMLGWSAWVHAQAPIYRCGNEYTNHVPAAKQSQCKRVDGGQVTIVHGSAPAAGVAATGGSASPTTKPTSNAAAATPSPSVSAQQRERDRDALAILQAELNKAQGRLAALQQEYNGGQPLKSALELRNPQVYSERIETLKAQITRQEADIAGIQRELARRMSQ